MKKVNDIVLRGYVSLLTLPDSLSGDVSTRFESKSAKLQAAGGFVGGVAALGSTAAFAAGGAKAGSEAAGSGGCTGAGTSSVISLIQTGGGFLAAIVAAVSVLMLLYASMLYITSGGNYGRAGKAKETAKNVVIGFGLAACIFILRTVILQIVEGAGGEGKNTVTSCLESAGKTGIK